jgi:two-component system sensor histidine kinase BarA
MDLQNAEAEKYSSWPADSTMMAYPLVKGEESNRSSASDRVSQQKITRPLSLKKIRDDYLRDSQPREDYRRETPRDTQPRYESLRLQNQGTISLLNPPKNSAASGYNTMTAHVDSQASEQERKDLGSHRYANSGNVGGSINDTLAILDWQDALTRSANKPDLAAKLIIMMLDTINDEKQALTQAWIARDRNTLAQIAHRILGGSRYTGVPQLRQASQDLEDKCLLNIQHTTPAQFAMLEPYYEALLTALNNLQALDLSAYPQLNYHRLSENDMTWKMI